MRRDMSLIGPRPVTTITPWSYRYGACGCRAPSGAAWHQRICQVRHGYIEGIEGVRSKDADLRYISKHSILVDLKIAGGQSGRCGPARRSKHVLVQSDTIRSFIALLTRRWQR
jgi:lipopolysaccharide/colanic/teichoic acid biosynthesis glycosyltransferase